MVFIINYDCINSLGHQLAKVERAHLSTIMNHMRVLSQQLVHTKTRTGQSVLDLTCTTLDQHS